MKIPTKTSTINQCMAMLGMLKRGEEGVVFVVVIKIEPGY
jgi:hypothetical protein